MAGARQAKYAAEHVAKHARRVVFYDLETSIVARAANGSGGRRNLIVEIGAVCDQGQAFHRLVDPRRQGMSLMETFEHTGQNAERTLRFWYKLFGEKKMLSRHRSRNVEARCARLEHLFDGDAFVTTRTALTQFVEFVYHRGENPLLVAHNGNSFDHPIMRMHLDRLALPAFNPLTFQDSLRPARQLLPHLKSHTLSNLHKHLVREPFVPHHALSDALALASVCRAMADRERVPLQHLWTAESLTSLRGVGPKTARALRGAGYTYARLKRAVQTHAECPPELKTCIRNHKSLWRKLRKKWAEDTTPPATPRRTPRRRAARPKTQLRRRSKSL